MAKKQKSPDGGLSHSVTHLLHRVLQLALDYHAEASGPAGLTQRQYTVLAAAGAGDGVSQSDLVRATGIDRSTLADLVARMIAKGLLERERSATDARANTVRLSAAGKAALGEGGKPAATVTSGSMSMVTDSGSTRSATRRKAPMVNSLMSSSTKLGMSAGKARLVGPKARRPASDHQAKALVERVALI